MGILVAILVGGLAGWIASMIVGRDNSMGVLWNVVVGFIGAVLMNFLFGTDISLSHPTWGGFGLAILGAVVLLFLVNLFTNRRGRNV